MGSLRWCPSDRKPRGLPQSALSMFCAHRPRHRLRGYALSPAKYSISSDRTNSPWLLRQENRAGDGAGARRNAIERGEQLALVFQIAGRRPSARSWLPPRSGNAGGLAPAVTAFAGASAPSSPHFRFFRPASRRFFYAGFLRAQALRPPSFLRGNNADFPLRIVLYEFLPPESGNFSTEPLLKCSGRSAASASREADQTARNGPGSDHPVLGRESVVQAVFKKRRIRSSV